MSDSRRIVFRDSERVAFLDGEGNLVSGQEINRKDGSLAIRVKERENESGEFLPRS